MRAALSLTGREERIVKSLIDRLEWLIRMSRRRHYPEIVTVLLSFTAISLGVILIVNPDQYTSRDTYLPAMNFASPLAWGITFVLGGLMMVGGVFWARSVAVWPVGGMAVLWGTWAFLLFAGAVDGGVPSAAVGYTVASWVCLALALVYWNDEVDRGEGRHAAP